DVDAATLTSIKSIVGKESGLAPQAESDLKAAVKNLADSKVKAAYSRISGEMQLDDENRMFVLEGLRRMNAGSRPAMKALINAARLNAGEITSTDLGYRLGPRVNAAGRMDDARIAYRLLTGDDPVANDRLALELEELNRKRQQATRNVLAAAREFATANGPVFAYGDDWHPGVIGLVAGRLAEANGRPAFVASVRDGVAQGSARSPEGFSVVAALSACAHILDRHGGHPRAGGFTLAGWRLDEFAAALRELWTKAGAPSAKPVIEADCRIRPESISWDILQLVQDLEPYGQGFPAPLFAISGLRLAERRTVGGDHSHLRPVFAGLPPDLSAIWFGGGAHVGALTPGHDYDIAFRLAKSTYQGQTRLDMLIEDVRAAG
ncbi:MAG: DHHA1 domain-containing protein, partial [Chloroflexota bacterium]|nr:DHHA1 domain-containing protein [Chloroflexota bacterium]